MPNSTALTLAEQTHVAQWMIDHPDAIPEQCAVFMKCTPAQVRYAMKKADAGKLRVRRKGLSPEQRAAVVMGERSVDDLIGSQIHFAIAQLEGDTLMPADERIGLLGTIARTHRTVLEARLQGHLKATDAGVIYTIIRAFKPDATEEECIKIYLEGVERWKASQA